MYINLDFSKFHSQIFGSNKSLSTWQIKIASRKKGVNNIRSIPKILSLSLTVISSIILVLSLIISQGLPDVFEVKRGNILSLYSPISVNQKSTNNPISKTIENKSNISSADIMLFGIIPIKSVMVEAIDPVKVYIGGDAFGIKVYTDGVIVVSMSSVETSNGYVNPAEKCGIKVGDVIMAVNGKTVTTNRELSEIITQCKGQTLKFSIKRGSSAFDVDFTPAISKNDGIYKAGIWVRDSTAGIGTMTYIDPVTKVYGGLGHAVCDIDTGEIMPIQSGETLDAEVYDVSPSSKGSPGEIKGRFTNTSIGKVLLNCDCGVYGICDKTLSNEIQYEIALPQDVKKGDAKIICEVSGEKAEYDCVIEKVLLNNSNGLRDMVIRITDPTLLSLSGGIVQGMSGSPIIQNDKLVGAVTHVIVDDPTKGYGIFAYDMYKTGQTIISDNNLKKAS